MRDKVYIIAEAGVNHNGDITLAKKLIDVAADAGADSVKFQTFNSKKLVSKFAEKAKYQKQSTDASESQLKMLQRLELSYDNHFELQNYAVEKGIDFLSSPFDIESIEFLDKLGIDIFKIPSGEITNLPYLRKIGLYGKKVILSTGMSYLHEVEAALNVLIEAGTPKDMITVLHCNTEYPTPMRDVNLLAMNEIKAKLDVEIGYSDHTNGIEVPVAAVALGARVIEKHFTLDKELEGPDHKASLDPIELKDMVDAIRNIEAALGDGVKRPSESELKNIQIARKSIVARCLINEGDVFTTNNVTIKRPGTGINPMKWDEVIGKRATRSFAEDEVIQI